MSRPSPEEQVQFLGNLQRLLAEGSFVATYKYALLLAITELCIRRGDDCDRPLRLTSTEIAERYVELYWRQASPYVARDGRSEPLVLRQNTGRQASIIEALVRAKARSGESLAALKADRRAWRELVGRIARTVETMPLWKLQTIGGEPIEFLYSRGDSSSEAVLRPGVAFCFRKFHALIRDLVQSAWLRFVRRVPGNASVLGEAHELGEFLFGSERLDLAPFQPILRDLQENRCFYCGRAIRERGEVDHFVPWAMYPSNLGHNLVLADATCNNGKSDRLPAREHLERWCRRNVEDGGLLAGRLDEAGLGHDLSATWEVARWAYQTTSDLGVAAWRGPARDRLVPLDVGWATDLDAACRLWEASLWPRRGPRSPVDEHGA